jgi:hypothetical protein
VNEFNVQNGSDEPARISERMGFIVNHDGTERASPELVLFDWEVNDELIRSNFGSQENSSSRQLQANNQVIHREQIGHSYRMTNHFTVTTVFRNVVRSPLARRTHERTVLIAYRFCERINPFADS